MIGSHEAVKRIGEAREAFTPLQLRQLVLTLADHAEQLEPAGVTAATARELRELVRQAAREIEALRVRVGDTIEKLPGDRRQQLLFDLAEVFGEGEPEP